MDFDEAGQVVMPFGRYHLQPLAKLLAEKPGYVKFLLGLLERGQIISSRLAEALRAYRDSPEVVKALDKAKAKKSANGARARSRHYAARRWGNYFDQ